MTKKLLSFISVCSLLILGGCGNNTNVNVALQQGSCPNGVLEAPYCMSVQISNNGGQTFITNTSFPISGLSVVTNGAVNVQTPSTNQSTMDPNNCTNSTISPGGNCTYYLKISFESYPTTSAESVNVTMNYTLNNTLFGGSNSSSSTSFTVYEVTNLYAAQSNGYVGIFNIGGSTNFFAESYGDLINTSVADTSSYGFLYLGGNNGTYRVGNESGNESSSSSISPSAFSGPTTNMFTLSSNLYATPGSSVWMYSLSSESWNNSATYTLGTTLRPNANAVSPGGVIYLASANQVFTCGSVTTTTSCQADGIATNSGLNPPGTINAIAFPNSGVTPYTGFYIGAAGGLFAESGAINSSNNTWIAIKSSNGATLPAITSMVSYNSNLYAADANGNIWLIPNAYVGGSAPTAQLLATAAGTITAMVIDSIGGVLYFATTSGNTSNLYGCNITQNTCTITAGPSSLFPVVSLSIASQLVTSI